MSQESEIVQWFDIPSQYRSASNMEMRRFVRSMEKDLDSALTAAQFGDALTPERRRAAVQQLGLEDDVDAIEVASLMAVKVSIICTDLVDKRVHP